MAARRRAFVFVPETRYEEVSTPWMLMHVLRKELDPEDRYSVRQNVWPEEADITFARSATKHRISRQRSLYVIEHCGLQIVDRFWNPVTADLDRKVYFLGEDLEEVALEVVAVESWEEDYRVIHAMELRKRFGAYYEEARAWAK